MFLAIMNDVINTQGIKLLLHSLENSLSVKILTEWNWIPVNNNNKLNQGNTYIVYQYEVNFWNKQTKMW